MKMITTFIIVASISFILMISCEAASWTSVAKLGNSYMWMYSIMQGLDGELYAATSDGLFKTTGSDTNWKKIHEESFSCCIQASDGTIYAGQTYDGGVYKTTDLGESWEKTNLRDKSSINCLLEAADGTIYVGTSSGLYGTIDGGENWEVAGKFRVYCLLEAADGIIYVGTRHYVYRTTDAGITWTKTFDLGDVFVNCLLESSDGAIYLGIGASVFYPGAVYKTTNGGVDWQKTADLNGVYKVYCLLESSDGAIYAGTSPNGDVFRTRDGGVSWEDTGILYYPLSFGSIRVSCLLQTTDSSIYAAIQSCGMIFKLEGDGKTSLEIRASRLSAKPGEPYALEVTIQPINQAFDAWAVLDLVYYYLPSFYYSFKLDELNTIYEGVHPFVRNVQSLPQAYTTTLFSVSSLSPWVRENFDTGRIIVTLTPAGEPPVDSEGNINCIPGYIDIKRLFSFPVY